MSNNKNDYSSIAGCWIDSAVPRTSLEIAQAMSQLAKHLEIEDVDIESPPSNLLNEEDMEMWLDDVIYELDEKINEKLSEHGYLASWENGDYIIFHQSEYFENPEDYFIKE
jgi:hypothetical protein